MKEKPVTFSRRKYDAAFKEEVLQMVFNGRPVSEVARSLGIGENIIYRWKSRHKARENKGKEQALAAPDYQALHKRILELETERDILKKALAIFSRQT